LRVFLLNLVFFCICFTCIAQDATAQGPGQHKNKLIRKLQRVVWTAGIHGVVIDDDGHPLKKLFNVGDSWSFVPFPSRLTVEAYVDKGLSIEGGFVYSKLKKGKLESGDRIRTKDAALFAFDASAKYNLNELIGDTKWFSPYAIGGFGYTYRGVTTPKNGIMANIGLGFTAWFYKGFGLNLQSMAKFAINGASSNYLMHSAGVVYRFNLLTGYKTPDRIGHRYTLFRNL
jgi:OOP family OmpA-OmpF porin